MPAPGLRDAVLREARLREAMLRDARRRSPLPRRQPGPSAEDGGRTAPEPPDDAPTPEVLNRVLDALRKL